MLFKTDGESPDTFWREYEEKTGEKVLARGFGKYVSGWDEFDKKRWNGIWGLIIDTTGGFRFHHFPQNNFLDVLIQFNAGNKEPPKEKTIFLPKEKIISQSVFLNEKKWWKKLLFPVKPQLVINYRDEEKEKNLIFDAEYTLRK